MSQKQTKALPLDRIHELFDIDYEIGELRWKVNRGNCKIGSIAGSDQHGYRVVGIDGANYYIHRIIYATYHNTDDPSLVVHHRDNDGLNNSIHNLDLATNRENLGQQGKHISGETTFGVTWNKQHKKWHAKLRNPKTSKQEYIGLYLDQTTAYQAVRAKYYEYHGEYPPLDSETLQRLK